MATAKESKELSKEQQIGFHLGSLDVLKKEHEEFSRILAIVEQLIQAHTKALTDLGVTSAPVAKSEAPKKEEPKKKVPIEHLI